MFAVRPHPCQDNAPRVYVYHGKYVIFVGSRSVKINLSCQLEYVRLITRIFGEKFLFSRSFEYVIPLVVLDRRKNKKRTNSEIGAKTATRYKTKRMLHIN